MHWIKTSEAGTCYFLSFVLSVVHVGSDFGWNVSGIKKGRRERGVHEKTKGKLSSGKHSQMRCACRPCWDFELIGFDDVAGLNGYLVSLSLLFLDWFYFNGRCRWHVVCSNKLGMTPSFEKKKQIVRPSALATQLGLRVHSFSFHSFFPH